MCFLLTPFCSSSLFFVNMLLIKTQSGKISEASCEVLHILSLFGFLGEGGWSTWERGIGVLDPRYSIFYSALEYSTFFWKTDVILLSIKLWFF